MHFHGFGFTLKAKLHWHIQNFLSGLFGKTDPHMLSELKLGVEALMGTVAEGPRNARMTAFVNSREDMRVYPTSEHQVRLYDARGMDIAFEGTEGECHVWVDLREVRPSKPFGGINESEGKCGARYIGSPHRAVTILLAAIFVQSGYDDCPIELMTTDGIKRVILAQALSEALTAP
jgi:hypothetical protein